jgi:hypothetical protein
MDSPGVKCKNRGDLFYPENPSSEVRKAQAVCNGLEHVKDEDGNIIEYDVPCPYKAICGRYAIDNHENHGVWGGMSERDRRKVNRARRLLKDPTIYTLEDVKFPGKIEIPRRPVKLSLVKKDARSGHSPGSNVSRPK